jgi:hypothetical protein
MGACLLRCVLQWYYLTGNTCNPGPCNPADPKFPNCDRLAMGYCGTRLQSYPEVRARGELAAPACR